MESDLLCEIVGISPVEHEPLHLTLFCLLATPAHMQPAPAASVLAQNNLNNNDIQLVMETSQVSYRGLGIGHLPSLSVVCGNPLAHLLLCQPPFPPPSISPIGDYWSMQLSVVCCSLLPLI